MFFDDHKIVFDCGGKGSFGINAKVLLVDQPDHLDHVLLGVWVQGFRLASTLFFFAAACPSSSSFFVVLLALAGNCNFYSLHGLS
jgi:hypothetical protein